MKTKDKLSIGNYLGYTLVDVGNSLAFAAMGSFLTVFYTDVFGISPVVTGIIMIIARIWDGINDPIMGFLVQARKPKSSGKYRPFLLWGGIPLAFSAALVFLPVSNWISTEHKAFMIAFAAFTYILYGMLYTVVLVPYGSLATVMTRKTDERSLLSVCRSIGGGIGSLPASIVFPMIVWADKEKTQLDSGKLFGAMCVIGVLMIIMYTVGYKSTRETVPPSNDKINVMQSLKSIIKDKTFVIMSIEGCLLMASANYLNSVNVYIFKDYFGNGGLVALYTIIAYAPMVIMIPFVNKIINKIGKKEISIIGLVVSVIASFILFAFRFENSTAYMIMSFFVNAGVSFMTLEIWAMAMDVIDHQEMVTGRREEASNYAVFTFMRKVGQAIGALAPVFLGLVGYDTDLVGKGQSAATVSGMYSVATLVPFIMFAVMLVLMIAYPLNKKKAEEMKNTLKEMRGEK